MGRAVSVCTPTKQWAGLSVLGSCSGQKSIIYVVDIQGCQQHPTPTALAWEPGLARPVTVRGVRVDMRVLINIDWGLINPKLHYLDWGVWHVVPLGDVGQHTLPCSVKSVPGRPCRRTPELDPGRGRGMGAISHLGGAGSERGGGHTPSSVVRWATSQLAPSEGVRYVSGCHAVTPSMGRARLCRQCRW